MTQSSLPWLSTLALALAACSAPGGTGADQTSGDGTPRPAQAGAADPAEVPAPPADERAEAQALEASVRQALDAGDYVDAAQDLDRLIVLDTLERTRGYLAAGTPREALQPLDRALELAPEDPRVLALRGEAAYAAAPGDSQPGFFYEDALRYFERAAQAGYQAKGEAGPQELRMVVRASQAARRVPNPELALTRARYAAKVRDGLAEAGAELPELEDSLHRVWAEAAFDRYLELREADPSAAQALFAETEDQLERALGEAPADPWALEQLANLNLWAGRTDEARRALERAVELAAENEALQQRAFRHVWDNYGAEEAVAYAAGLRQAHPDSPFGYWYGGSAEFYAALEAFLAPDSVRDVDAFARAEALFARCRELQPSYAEACLNHEASCRTAVGWCHFQEGDLQAAEDEFRSAGEVFDGGLAASVDARLWNALAGLTSLAARHAENPRDLEGQRRAAELAWTVFQANPDDANYANNAGFFNRDAAVLQHALAMQTQATAVEHDEGEEKDRLMASARQRRAEAQRLIERSWAAYERAAELAPEDVRIVNDAGLIMTYYLRTDADKARELLLQAVAAGEEQRAWSDPESDLNEAWGDAHQNLAVLYLTWLDDPALAKRYMEKALEIGPPSREGLRPMVAFCDQRLAGEVEGGGLFERMIWSTPTR